MKRPLRARRRQYWFIFCSICLLCGILVSACISNTTNEKNSTPHAVTATASAKATSQMLRFPLVGTADLSTLDPARDPDQDSAIVMTMIYSGLVRSDSHLNVIPDQATWQMSPDGRTYTFTLQPSLTFSDGTPITAQTYLQSWTRALSSSLATPATFALAAPIVGASRVYTGKTHILSGVRALNVTTLQVKLDKATPAFLTSLTNPFFLPINPKLISQYNQQSWNGTNWNAQTSMLGLSSGPFLIQNWQHNISMALVPNPHYYGNAPQLKTITLDFVNDPRIAYQLNGDGRYDFDWDIASEDQAAAKGANFKSTPLLQTDALFFDTTQSPFDSMVVRQAFAYAIDKQALSKTIFDSTTLPANTLLPPGMPGYQADYDGFDFDANKARSLFDSVYPDRSKFPSVTFSYSITQMPNEEAQMLQLMWQKTLGVKITLLGVDDDAYQQEVRSHSIALGMISWTATAADPAQLLSRLTSNSRLNSGQWKNQDYDDLVSQAEANTGDDRLALYQQAEQIAISQAGWIPLDHQTMAALIPSWVHGITLNGEGLYFGDWSDVCLSSH